MSSSTSALGQFLSERSSPTLFMPARPSAKRQIPCTCAAAPVGRRRATKGARLALLLALLTLILIASFSAYGASSNQAISVRSTSINFEKQPINTTARSANTVTNSRSHTPQIQAVTLTDSSAFTLTGWTGQIALQVSQASMSSHTRLAQNFRLRPVRNFLARPSGTPTLLQHVEH